MKAHALAAMAAALAVAGPARAALVISKAPTANVSCASGVCTATAAGAVLNVADLKHLLNAADLRIESGSAAMDIVFDAKMSWTKPHRLTLDALRSIEFDFEITAQGPGGVTLAAGGGSAGLLFMPKGRVSFWDTSSSFILNGTSYVLANDIATLAAGIRANPSGFFALGRGYDASQGQVYKTSPISTVFSGVFEGLGHTISNLTVQQTKGAAGNQGLFAVVDTHALVRDLVLEGAFVGTNGRDSYVGALAGLNAGTIEFVSVNGTVRTGGRRGFAGGMAGSNTGTILHARSSGAVNSVGYDSAGGGLVGLNAGTIDQSSSSADVVGNYAACGLVATNNGGVTRSFATGNVAIAQPQDNESPQAAGLACSNSGGISQSFASGSVDAGFGISDGGNNFTAYGGGLIAVNLDYIADCYSTAPVSAQSNDAVGGLVGLSTGTILNSYSSGAVSAPPEDGGLIGDLGSDNALDAATYWDTDSSGIADPAQGAGNIANAPGIFDLSTVQLRSKLPAGFDFAVWGLRAGINGGLPYLLANPPG
jgi:hypothetical protein